jgi:hypothetical protein
VSLVPWRSQSAQQPSELGFEELQLSLPMLDGRQLCANEFHQLRPHSGPASIQGGRQCLELRERKAQRAGAAHEQQPRDTTLGIEPIS